MINKYVKLILLTVFLFQFSGYAQDENDEPLLGLPGDDLDLYAVLDVFQNSKTIEDFEKSLNDENVGVNNLDLNNDGKVDFIKVVTEQDGDDFLFILQDPISEKETQDVAVIAVSKDEAGKVYMQIIGDEALYGKDYVVEPSTEVRAASTANPGYVGEDPVTVNVEATTEVIVVESTPVVQYVYSTTYVPYYTPYYYGYYPHWWRPVAVVSIGIYRRNRWHHHHHYHRGRGSVHVHHHNHYNNYNRNKRNTSNTVNNNIKNGNFKTAGQTGSRPSTSQGNRGGTNAATSNRASTANRSATSNNKSTANNRSSNSSQNRSSSANRSSNYNRSSSSSQKSSASRSMNSSNRSSGASRSGGGRSMGGGRRR